MEVINPQIEESWKQVLKAEFSKPYFISLKQFLVDEKKKNLVFPPGEHIFKAFNTTPFNKVKVVILGQDPYHGIGQAHGLSFSVNAGVPFPPSLVNIFKEIQADLGYPRPASGDLNAWARQGVLLLNTVLTVRENTPESHKNKGWEQFTDCVIQQISNNREKVVFILWGNNAKAKMQLIDGTKHLVLTAAHPSPLSASRGFFGCRHFSKVNEYLQQNGMEAIDWKL